MKRAIVLLGLMLAPWIAQAEDFQISVLRKKTETARAGVGHDGDAIKGTEKCYYQVTVARKAFKPSAAIQARYILFVEKQELAQKAGTEQVEKIKGDGKIESLKPQGKTTFNTSEVTLREQSLTGGWSYTNGGRIKAKDSLVGIWIKLFDGETEVGEYINPTTLSSKYKWN